MKRKEAHDRKHDILYFIYENRISSTEQIYELFFNSIGRAKLYLISLEKKGLLAHFYTLADRNHSRPIKIYHLTYAGFNYLGEHGFKDPDGRAIRRYNIAKTEAQIRHDMAIIDVLVNLVVNEKIHSTKYKTELFLRRERKARNTTERIPDLYFEDKDGPGFMEFERAARQHERLVNDIEDYKAYYKGHKKLFVVPEDRANYYNNHFTEYNLKNWQIHTYKDKKLRIRAQG